MTTVPEFVWSVLVGMDNLDQPGTLAVTMSDREDPAKVDQVREVLRRITRKEVVIVTAADVVPL